MYTYIKSEPQLWTVGSDRNGKWEPESDHSSAEEASKRVRFLNGGAEPSTPVAPQQRRAELAQLMAAAITGMLASEGSEKSWFKDGRSVAEHAYNIALTAQCQLDQHDSQEEELLAGD